MRTNPNMHPSERIRALNSVRRDFLLAQLARHRGAQARRYFYPVDCDAQADRSDASGSDRHLDMILQIENASIPQICGYLAYFEAALHLDQSAHNQMLHNDARIKERDRLYALAT